MAPPYALSHCALKNVTASLTRLSSRCDRRAPRRVAKFAFSRVALVWWKRYNHQSDLIMRWLMKSRLHLRRRILLVPALVLMFTTVPAFTQSAPPATADLQARIEAAGAALGSIPKFKRLSAKDRQQL